MNQHLIDQMKEDARRCLDEQKNTTSNEGIKQKLNTLSAICEKLATVSGEKALTVAEAARRHPDLSEQTLRNGGEKGNRYLRVFRAWERVADAVIAEERPVPRSGFKILTEADLHVIKDQTLRHQVHQVFVQNRSLHNTVTTLKKLQKEKEIRLVDGPERSAASAEGLVLTSAELDALQDFVNPRKLKAKQLKPSKDDGVHTVDGQAVADPGFLSALRKIVKSYERPQ
jgi:hypothetical protein